MALADFDLDGWLDVYVVNNRFVGSENSEVGPAPPDTLFRSNGNGTFTDISDLLTWPNHGVGFVAAWTDVDADGDPDLYVVNDHGGWIQPNQLFRNDSSPTGGPAFVNISNTCGCDLAAAGMGIALGDYDHDGFIDLYVTNETVAGSGTETLLRATGTGLYVDVTLDADAVATEVGAREVGWGTEFFDYDNDGWLDIAVAFGSKWPDQPPAANALLRNREGTFSLVEGSGMDLVERRSEGLVVFDSDGDGCQDVLVQNLDGPPDLYRNRCVHAGNWLGLELQGTSSNRDAVGAWVQVTTEELVQVAEVAAGSSSVHSSRPRRLQFGLGAATTAEVRVRWPAGGVQEASYGVGQTVVIVED